MLRKCYVKKTYYNTGLNIFFIFCLEVANKKGSKIVLFSPNKHSEDNKPIKRRSSKYKK